MLILTIVLGNLCRFLENILGSAGEFPQRLQPA